MHPPLITVSHTPGSSCYVWEDDRNWGSTNQLGFGVGHLCPLYSLSIKSNLQCWLTNAFHLYQQENSLKTVSAHLVSRVFHDGYRHEAHTFKRHRAQSYTLSRLHQRQSNMESRTHRPDAGYIYLAPVSRRPRK
jgi:hypothetical protein